MFKDDVFYCVQSLEEKLEDLDSLTLNYWVANSSKKLLIRTVVAIRLVPCMELFLVYKNLNGPLVLVLCTFNFLVQAKNLLLAHFWEV